MLLCFQMLQCLQLLGQRFYRHVAQQSHSRNNSSACDAGLADYVSQQEDEADLRGLQLARDIAQVPPCHTVHMHPGACRADMHIPSCSM